MQLKFCREIQSKSTPSYNVSITASGGGDDGLEAELREELIASRNKPKPQPGPGGGGGGF